MPNFTQVQLMAYEARRLAAKNRNKNNDSGTVAVVESVVVNDSLAEAQLQTSVPCRFLVRVCSVRKRLLDDDNLSAKFLVDQIRYAGIIPDDNPEICKIEVTQRKVEENEPEHVIIEIENL